MITENSVVQGGYLFVHFTGEELDGEQVYMALSRDGLRWTDLSEKPILRSSVGMKGVRDPFPVRDPKTGRCFILATDLRIEAGLGWGTAQYEGSRDIVVWESDDLVHWSRERAVTVGIPEAGCVWAPEAVYDPKEDDFFVFFASMVAENGEAPKQRIYACRTVDFRTFTKPFQWIERPAHIIDTTVFEHSGKYFRVSGDDFTHHLLFETADGLEGTWTAVSSPMLDSLDGVEGPECYLLPDRHTVCLIADFIWTGQWYLPMTTDAPGEKDFTLLPPDAFDMGVVRKRHGGVVRISEDEYARLTAHFRA